MAAEKTEPAERAEDSPAPGDPGVPFPATAADPPAPPPLSPSGQTGREGILVIAPDWRVVHADPLAVAFFAEGRDPVGADARARLPALFAEGDPGLLEACRRCLRDRLPATVERPNGTAARRLVARILPSEGGAATLFLADLPSEAAFARPVADQASPPRHPAADHTPPSRSPVADPSPLARLAEREGMLRALCDATPDLLFAKDRDGRLIHANPATLALLGRRAEEVLCRTEADWLADPERAAAIRANDRRIMDSGAAETVEEWAFDARYGEDRLFQSTKAPLRDPATGAVVGLVGVGRDVTEAHRATAALAGATQRLEATLETARLGAWHWHVPSGRVAFDARWASMLGYAPDEIEPHVRAWERLVHPEDMPRVAAVLAAHLEGRTPVYECEHRLRHRDGGWIWVLDRGRVLERDAEGRPVLATGTHLDITARKEAEARLEAEEAEARRALATLQAVYDQAPIGLCVLGTDLRWQRINGRLAEINGLPPEAHLGRHVAEVLPDLADQAEALLRPVIERGEPLTGIEIVGETPAQPGVTRAWEENFYPLRDAAGRVIGINVVCEEVTGRRAAQAELERLNRELEARVQAEVAAREEAQARAAHAERVQALGQLAGGIAHDINNVLQAVRGAATLIDRRAGADPEAVRRFARLILDATERGAGITRRLLAFARRAELRAERIEPEPLLAELREVLAHTLGSPIAVRVESAPELPPILADKGQLETVLVNLATNARDAMPEGGTLTLRAAPETVAEDGGPLRPGRYLRLAVADTGTGIDPAILPRLFEPFFTTKPRDRGTGLGLSMAKGFAEQSGGGLAVESAPGQGATVTLWLPVAPDEVAEPDATPPPRDAASPRATEGAGPARRRILVVDDEAMVRETLSVALEDSGFAVLTAADGAEALSLIDAGEPFDALVSDLAMPGMGGLALIAAAQERRPGLPALLMTGYAGEATQHAVGGRLRGTSYALLRKPVPPALLADRIEALLASQPEPRRRS